MYREEEEENLFAKKAGCQKGLQAIDAGYHTHNKTQIDQILTNCCHLLSFSMSHWVNFNCVSSSAN